MNSCAIQAELSRFPRIFVTASYLNRDWLVEHHDWRIIFNEISRIPLNKKKNQFAAIRAIRGLCGIGVLDLYLPICISPDIRTFHHLAISTTSFHSSSLKFFLTIMHTNLTMMSSLFKHLIELNTCDIYSTFILSNNGIDETRN